MSVIEKQVIYKALKEPSFGRDVFSKLPNAAFTENNDYRELYLIIKRYYMSNNVMLDENTLLTLVEDSLLKRNASTDKISGFMDTVQDLYTIESMEQNNEVIGESIQKWVRKTMTIAKIKDVLTTGDLEDDDVINNLSDELKEIAVLDTSGTKATLFDFFEDTEEKREMYKNMKQDLISTGFAQVDRISGGGLARGELGLVNAISGGGKSLVATQLATNYVKRGMNTLYIVLEEKLDRMLVKFEQNLSGIGQRHLIDEFGNLNEELYDGIQSTYKQHGLLGRLMIAKYSPQEVSVSMLEQIVVDASIRKGIRLDAVIIDYPDLMKNHHLSSVSESDAGGKLYEDIRALTQKYNYVCWVLSQLNRTAYGQDLRTAESIEGSKRKLNAVEISLTINQKKEEFEHGMLRFHVDKLRYSAGGFSDKILYYRVNPETLQMRDASMEEAEENRRLIKDEDAKHQSDPKKTYDGVVDRITNINKGLSF